MREIRFPVLARITCEPVGHLFLHRVYLLSTMGRIWLALQMRFFVIKWFLKVDEIEIVPFVGGN